MVFKFIFFLHKYAHNQFKNFRDIGFIELKLTDFFGRKEFRINPFLQNINHPLHFTVKQLFNYSFFHFMSL